MLVGISEMLSFTGLIVAIIAGACRALRLTVEVFLHHQFGVRYVSIAVVAYATLLILLWKQQFSGEAADAMQAFLWAFWGLAGLSWLRIWHEWLTGPIVNHSYYPGYPLLVELFPSLDERFVRQYLEPAIVFGLGWLLSPFVQSLSNYLMMVGVIMFFANFFWKMGYHRDQLDLQDALIESEMRARGD